MTRLIPLLVTTLSLTFGAACSSSPAQTPLDQAPRQEAAAPAGVLLRIYDVRDLAPSTAAEQLARELSAACRVQVDTGPGGSEGMLMIRATDSQHGEVAAHLDRLRRAHATR